MRVEVLSLGGSLIVPDDVQTSYLRRFKKLISRCKDRKFVIVTGGGSTARKYMRALESEGVSQKEYAMVGVRIVRFHARFMAKFFGSLASQQIPNSLADIKRLLKTHRVVFAGALAYHESNTSDGTAAEIANYFKTRFINMTNIKGFYDKNPLTEKDAHFVPHMGLKAFYDHVSTMEYKPGQHYVIDQRAVKIIYLHNVPTYIVGPDLSNLSRLLKGQSFIGTTID